MDNFSSSEQAAIVQNIRRVSGVAAGSGPSDQRLVGAVQGFIQAFEHWYIRVMKEAVAKYRFLIIRRINPLVRKMECGSLPPDATANRLVEDYNSRNFVTAGGWALEEMAVRVSDRAQKGAAEGIDIQRFDHATGNYHLYVLKSGLVTRNSDIVNALKRHARQAEKLLMQGQATGKVIANWAIAAGKTSSTFEDGIRRPSSAEFWSEMIGLPPRESIELVLAIAAEAGRLVRRDATDHIGALKLLVADYIAKREEPLVVDWDFIALRNMHVEATWKVEDKERHKRALDRLAQTGYVVGRPSPRKAK